jgi:hypothetical protein
MFPAGSVEQFREAVEVTNTSCGRHVSILHLSLITIKDLAEIFDRRPHLGLFDMGSVQ